MNAPRELARRDPWAQSVARALTPPSLAPAFAVERDLSDPSIWRESIWRSQRRREAMERQLNFGPVTGKRVAVPLAMLAAGLMARDAIVSSGDGIETAAAGAQTSDTVSPTHRAAARHHAAAKPAGVKVAKVQPATHVARQAAAKPKPKPNAIAKPAPKPPAMADGQLVRGEHGAAIAAVQQKLG